MSGSSPGYFVGNPPVAALSQEVHSSTDISLQRLYLFCAYNVRESEPPRIREGPSSSMPSSVSLLLLMSSSSSLDSILPISLLLLLWPSLSLSMFSWWVCRDLYRLNSARTEAIWACEAAYCFSVSCTCLASRA